MSSEAPTPPQAPETVFELAELAAGIVADARSLRDHVTDLENDDMRISAAVDAADRLHETAAWVARELATEVKDFENFDDFKRLARK
jgi:hypothetical protein